MTEGHKPSTIKDILYQSSPIFIDFFSFTKILEKYKECSNIFLGYSQGLLKHFDVHTLQDESFLNVDTNKIRALTDLLGGNILQIRINEAVGILVDNGERYFYIPKKVN